MEGKPLRLQVYLAHSGVASRRACERLVADGRVSVNGVVVTEPGTKVLPSDEVRLDGKAVSVEARRRYVLMNKPAGLVCSASDEKGRRTAVSLLSGAFSERLYNVGRLDMFSSGALLFTNDGDFAARLSHPGSGVEKEYVVEASAPLPRTLAADFVRGVRVDGVFYRAKSAEDINSREMRVVLVEGKNREIRRVFEAAGARVRSLRRVRIGCVGLGRLRAGEFRELGADEVEALLALCAGGNKKEENGTESSGGM